MCFSNSQKNPKNIVSLLSEQTGGKLRNPLDPVNSRNSTGTLFDGLCQLTAFVVVRKERENFGHVHSRFGFLLVSTGVQVAENC